MKVVFKCCLSGNVFYKKGDEVLLEDSEALSLFKKGIVEIIDKEEKEEAKKTNNAKETKKGKQ